MHARILFCAALVLASAGVQAQAQSESANPLLSARHAIIVGAYKQDADASFYADVDFQDLPRTELDLGDLGMSETDTSWMVEYRFRFRENWIVSAAAYTFETNGRVAPRTTFEYDGVKFEAGVDVTSRLTVDTYVVDVLYKVYDNPRAQLYMGGGLHVADVSTELETRVFVGDAEREGGRAGDELLAPLPNLRMLGMYALSPKWMLTATLGWLSLSYDDYDGSFSYAHARLGYSITKQLSLSAGYQYLDMDFSVDRKGGEAGTDIQFNGPSIHLAYTF